MNRNNGSSVALHNLMRSWILRAFTGILQSGRNQGGGCGDCRFGTAKVFNPINIWFAAKPCELAFGVIPMALLGSCDCFGKS